MIIVRGSRNDRFPRAVWGPGPELRVFYVSILNAMFPPLATSRSRKLDLTRSAGGRHRFVEQGLSPEGLRTLAEAGQPVPDEIIAPLSPLGWEHITWTGSYYWREFKSDIHLLRPLRTLPFLSRKGKSAFRQPVRFQADPGIPSRPTEALFLASGRLA